MTNQNSQMITDAIASPVVLTPVGLSGGRERVIMGTMEVVAAIFDADNDTLRITKIPTGARITSIEFASDDLDGGTDSAVNVGLAEENGDIIDEDAYASAIEIFRAPVAMTRVENEARDINNVGEQVWQDAGKTTDPGGLVEIVLYQTAAVSSPTLGTLSWIIKYTID